MDEQSAFTVHEKAKHSKEGLEEIIEFIKMVVASQRMIPVISKAPVLVSQSEAGLAGISSHPLPMNSKFEILAKRESWMSCGTDRLGI